MLSARRATFNLSIDIPVTNEIDALNTNLKVDAVRDDREAKAGMKVTDSSFRKTNNSSNIIAATIASSSSEDDDDDISESVKSLKDQEGG